eukprot:366086-Chlamydomonas_euryale.AAC.20
MPMRQETSPPPRNSALYALLGAERTRVRTLTFAAPSAAPRSSVARQPASAATSSAVVSSGRPQDCPKRVHRQPSAYHQQLLLDRPNVALEPRPGLGWPPAVAPGRLLATLATLPVRVLATRVVGTRPRRCKKRGSAAATASASTLALSFDVDGVVYLLADTRRVEDLRQARLLTLGALLALAESLRAAGVACRCMCGGVEGEGRHGAEMWAGVLSVDGEVAADGEVWELTCGYCVSCVALQERVDRWTNGWMC